MSQECIRLSASKEAALVRQAQSPDDSNYSWAYLQLERAYWPLIQSYSRKIDVAPWQRPEIEQTLRIAFFNAVRRFDPTRGARLASFVKPHLAGTVTRVCSQVSARNLLSLDALLEAVEETGYAANAAQLSDGASETANTQSRLERDLYVIPAVQDFLKGRPTVQRKAALLMFLRGFTQVETAQELGITQQAVQQCRHRLFSAGQKELLHIVSPA